MPVSVILVQRASRLPGIPTSRMIARWARAALAFDIALTVRVVNGAEGRRLNSAFRARDHATNVLTFAYGGAPPDADIVLCAPVIAREARTGQDTGRALRAPDGAWRAARPGPGPRVAT